jgi:nucleotide-binding universal stress UspA family protein
MPGTRLWPKHIVVGVDLSGHSLAALRVALQMAEHLSATLSIVHVVPLPAGAPPLSESVALPEAGEELTTAENDLIIFVRRIAGRRAIPPYRILRAHASDGILFAARYEAAGLIIVGTRGAGGTSRLTLGSVAEQVLNRATVPVMTVTPQSAKRTSETVRRILCPVNLSAEAARALEYAVLIGKGFDADVIALEIMTTDTADAALERETHRLRHWLRAQMARATRIAPIVLRGEPAEEILDYARESRVDLIVVGARRDRFSARTVFGSTTERVTRHAPCTTLTITSAPR